MRNDILLLISLVWFVSSPLIGMGEESVEAKTAQTKIGQDETAIDPDILRPVQHETMRISAEENDAYFQVLEQAGTVNYRKLKEAARRFQKKRRSQLPRYRDNPKLEFPTFVDLFQHPQRYQGKPVTLRGHARRIIKHPIQKKHPDTQTRYEAWIYTHNSQTNPAVVVFTSLPAGMPMGDNLLERVAVTGYFFKLYGYDARDTTRRAPLILAPKLEWFPGEKQSDEPVSLLFYIIAGGAVALVLVAVLWLLRRTAQNDRRIRDSISAHRMKSELPAVDEQRINLPEDL